MKIKYNKTIIRFGFCDIRNNQDRGKCYQPKPKAEADDTKTESNNCFIIHCFEENNDKRIIAGITVYFQTLKNVQLSDHSRNHALRAQPTDYYRLVNNV